MERNFFGFIYVVSCKNVFSLRIVHATHQSEGDYQCSAIVRNIVLTPDHRVDSRLVSAPLKLRRARITKFERYEAPIVRVKQGQVNRQ